MKHLAALFLLLAASAAFGQTVKTLGFNTTNGHVVYSGTNALTFTNGVAASTIHVEQDASGGVYTLSIGQTNTGFRGAGGGPSDFGFYRNGVEMWNAAGDTVTFAANTEFDRPLRLNHGAGATAVISFGGITPSTGAAISRTNLGLGLPALTNTNATSFRSAIGLGDWATLSDGGALRSEDLTISDGEQTDYIRFTAGSGVAFFGNRASQFRTALGLGGGITTNITFVDASTNTNSVTISNGIITGWTQ